MRENGEEIQIRNQKVWVYLGWVGSYVFDYKQQKCMYKKLTEKNFSDLSSLVTSSVSECNFYSNFLRNWKLCRQDSNQL